MAIRSTQLKIQTVSASTNKALSKTLGYIANFADSDASTVAAAIDTAARAFNGMTTDMYNDTLIVETSSVNEILAE